MSEGGWEGRVRSVVAAITDGSTASPGQLCGLSDDVIRLIESDQPARPAEAYRLFLQLIGSGAGFFLQGSDVYYPKMLGLKEAACDLLSENESPFVFENSDRVFLMHQGYCFDFLRGSGPDPEVWSYSEGSSADTIATRTTQLCRLDGTRRRAAYAASVCLAEVFAQDVVVNSRDTRHARVRFGHGRDLMAGDAWFTTRDSLSSPPTAMPVLGAGARHRRIPGVATGASPRSRPGPRLGS